jgi:hypothetical protein
MTLLIFGPDVVCYKSSWDYADPIELACIENNTILEVVHALLDPWLKRKENLSSYRVNSLINQDTPDDVKTLLSYLSSLFDNDDHTSDKIKMNFIATNWWSGVWLTLNMHPAAIKTLQIPTSNMADFLSVVGKCCSLATMMVIIKNEPDLLEGV